jgi:DNA (cytosine-5)-methyltransferase 1
MNQLVLSLFPGIGLLDRAFEEEGFTVVRGPDLLWGGDIRTFHPPAGKFDGVIGGPPCQSFSPIGNVNRARYGPASVMPDRIPEFRRVVLEAAPTWWLMENSPHAYAPFTPCNRLELDNAWLGEAQTRRRAFWSNLPLLVEVPALVGVAAGTERTVSGKGSVDWQGSRAREAPRSVAGMLELQGFPGDLLEHCPFTVGGTKQMIGNGVPLPMGRAVAKAVKRALELPASYHHTQGEA